METCITEGIKVSVESFFQSTYSKPEEPRYVFAYRVTIENLGTQTVQLLRRHWIIFDSIGAVREIEGEGVIGKQPTLKPGDTHQYMSWCPLTTGMGKMHGTFLMIRKPGSEEFYVNIPEFELVAPFKLN